MIFIIFFLQTDTTVKKLVVPFSMDEMAFHQKILEAFPIIGESEIEICRVNRRRRVIPVELSSVCPAAIKACPQFGRSAVYVRVKVRTNDSTKYKSQISFYAIKTNMFFFFADPALLLLECHYYCCY